ncbi:Cof-type HAD-IIB family hydrolase [Fusobacterium sp.]|uniref:Cof-type HAD-IIB family hydrolase n=1 Tax=Fusobacterium sp. TaxID=68766 RepID=UPI00261CB843|nr:Cof-type HAD-IIB family hydrolase [Fusobacterium sp.]
MDRLQKQIKFILEIDKIKGILRQGLVLNGKRQETDAEHSWHMAMCAVLLKEYYHDEVDMLKVIKMILVHDIVEIVAGDTPAYGNYSQAEKEKNELEASKEIYGILPQDQRDELMEIWLEFEKGETKEAKFANACDRFQGFIQNVTSDAHTWRKFKVTKSKLMNRMRPIVNFIPEVYYGYIQGYMKEYLDNGVVTDDKPIKLIATDLDGTFVNSEKKVPEKNKEVINKYIDKGISFVPSSGRDLPSIKELLEDIKDIKYFSCFNGARIFRGEELIHSVKMDKEMCLDILKKGTELGLKYSGTSNYDVCYSQLDTEYYTEFKLKDSKYTFHSNENFDNLKAFDFEKIVFFGTQDVFKVLRKYVEEKYGDKVNIFVSGDYVIDIVSKKCSKGNALKIIAQDMGIYLDEVIAFGDNENDLSMLTEVGYPVAMKNAKEVVKNIISQITPVSNEEGGVGIYLDEFLKDK